MYPSIDLDEAFLQLRKRSAYPLHLHIQYSLRNLPTVQFSAGKTHYISWGYLLDLATQLDGYALACGLSRRSQLDEMLAARDQYLICIKSIHDKSLNIISIAHTWMQSHTDMDPTPSVLLHGFDGGVLWPLISM